MGGAIPAGGGSGGGFPLAGLPLAVGRRPIAQRGRDQTRRGPADHDDNRLAYGGGLPWRSHTSLRGPRAVTPAGLCSWSDGDIVADCRSYGDPLFAEIGPVPHRDRFGYAGKPYATGCPTTPLPIEGIVISEGAIIRFPGFSSDTRSPLRCW